ncbi:MAG: glyoxalase superfamily protein [Pseudomonadota bacterium]
MRAISRRRGHAINHATALERIARRWGHRNWNTLRATAPTDVSAAPTRHGARVAGRYLGHPFSGRVVRIVAADQGWRVTIAFDAPVDVSASPRFVAARRRVTALIDTDGVTAAKTSDGVPHLVLVGGGRSR